MSLTVEFQCHVWSALTLIVRIREFYDLPMSGILTILTIITILGIAMFTLIEESPTAPDIAVMV